MIRSVRRHLLVTQFSFLMVIIVAMVLWNYLDSYKEMEDIFDSQLSRSAHSLNSLLAFADEEGYLETLKFSMSSFEDHLMQQDFSHTYERSVIFQIWEEQGGLLLKSTFAPDTPLTSVSQGFVQESIDGHEWRVYVFSRPLMRYRFYVAERSDLRRDVATELALRSALPAFLLFPFIAWLIWRSVNRALAFIDASANRIEAEVPDNLTPISFDDVPEEVHPIIRALNSLFSRITASYEREKRFSADAAHELRSPLTAIKTHAQVAMRELDDVKRRRALENVVKGVDAANHLADQLLSLSRLENHQVEMTQVNLVNLIHDCVDYARPLANKKSQKLITTLSSQEIFVSGNESALWVLLRNLVDNAIKYTPDNGEIQILCHAYAQEIRLGVLDSGPGISMTDKTRVHERFHRGLGHKEQGSGLGLSIVNRVSALHGGKMSLKDRPDARSGLWAEIVFPIQGIVKEQVLSASTDSDVVDHNRPLVPSR